MYTYFIICIILICILYYYKENKNKNKNKESFQNKSLKGLIQPSYIPGVDFINQKHDVPSFNIDVQCKEPYLKKYLGWKCFANQIQKTEFNDDTNWKGTHFYNYLKNNPLKYDGIWGEECKQYNCLWKLF